MHAPTPHLTRLPAATHTQVRDQACTPITLPQHQSMPLPPHCPAPTHEILLRRLDQQHHEHERRVRQRRHDLRLVSGAVAGARMDARGGRMRGRVSADVRGGDACAQGWRGVGGRVERQPPPRREATGCDTERLRRRPHLPPRMHVAGKLVVEGQAAAARTRKHPRRAGGTRTCSSSVSTHGERRHHQPTRSLSGERAPRLSAGGA